MNVKKNYKKATHYCYAYILDDIKYANDDGEPSGTAGPPILNVLEKNKLTNILCIVVRYYGGIKLGAGGLIRAYGKSVREALLQATLKDVIDGYVVTFELDYDLITTINSLINNYKVLSKVFEEKIKYSIFLDTLDDEVLRSLNELNIKYEVEKKCL
jgi:uncharacterized YigZ family protein